MPVEELAETLVELADTLVDEFDLDAFLHLLANRCVRLLGVDAAGLLLIDHGGQLQAVGASNERTKQLELLEADNDEGPSLDCWRSGNAVIVSDLAETQPRWPRFTEAALGAGFAAVHTIPMRLRTEVIGALNLFHVKPGELDNVDARIAQAMADIATIGLLQSRAVRRQEHLAAQLQHALNSRVVVEQAKGVIAERLGLEMNAAFDALRTYARSHNKRVGELARSIVDREFDAAELLR